MKSKIAVAKPAATQEASLSDLALIVLTDIYDTATEKRYEEAVGHLEGVGELIRHHPALRAEARAIRRIADGERVLNHLRRRRAQL